MPTGVLVRADAAAVEEAAARLRTTAAQAQQATEPDPAPAVWTGPAAQAAADAADRMHHAAALLRDVALAAGGLLASFAAEVADLAAREAALDRATADVQAANAGWVAAGAAGRDPSLDLLVTVKARKAALAADYAELSGHLTHALDRLRVHIPHRPLHPIDQWEGLRDTAALNLAGTAGLAYRLTLDALLDRDRWWHTVQTTADALADTATHPAQAAKDSIGWDAFADGHWGAGTGALLGTLATRRPGGAAVLRHAVEHEIARRGEHQTLEDLLDHVDLDKHEGPGHTLGRHVVTVDYLRDRVTKGTLLPDGTRAGTPDVASTFTDRETAEIAITLALQQKERVVRRMMRRGRSTVIEIDDMRLGELGVGVRRADPLGPPVPLSGICVKLVKRGNRILVATAYPTVKGLP